MSNLAPAIVHNLRARYGLEIHGAAPLTSGHDTWADCWRMDTDRGELVLRADRGVSIQTADWLSDVQQRARDAGVPCNPPLVANDGAVAVAAGEATLTLRAFVQGAELDRDDPVQVRAAGQILARLHHAGPDHLAERPAPSPWHACFWPGAYDPPALRDTQLDAWHQAFAQRHHSRFKRGAIHGDFWAGNIIYAAGRVAAVIDFAEARLDALVRELAWSTWEFGRDDSYRLDVDRARTFLAGYRQVSGPWDTGLMDILIPLMRVELRRNARYSLADRGDSEYNEALQGEFARLHRTTAASLLEP